VEYTVYRTYEKKVDVKKIDFTIWGKRRIFSVIIEENKGQSLGTDRFFPNIKMAISPV